MFEFKQSIIKTIIYADIFDYPLTIDEIWKYLIANKKITKNQLIDQIKKIKTISCLNNLFFLKGKEKIVNKRLRRQKESEKKLLIAKRATQYLFLIPSISLIGVSGALAMKNSDKEDDIDFFIICKKGTIWISRLLLILILKLLKLHRSYKNQNIENKICLNMFIDQSALRFPSEREDLYNAHEIIQMVSLVEKDGMYKKFIMANTWVKEFLPNSIDIKILRYKDIQKRNTNCLIVQLFNCFLKSLEFIAKKVQLWKIKKHQTKEIVQDNFLAFHPKDYKKLTIEKFEKKLKNLTIS